MKEGGKTFGERVEKIVRGVKDKLSLPNLSDEDGLGGITWSDDKSPKGADQNLNKAPNVRQTSNKSN